MVPFQTIPPSEPFGWKDFFDSLTPQSVRTAGFFHGKIRKTREKTRRYSVLP